MWTQTIYCFAVEMVLYKVALFSILKSLLAINRFFIFT